MGEAIQHLRRRIVKLEAARRWHPASEPPEPMEEEYMQGLSREVLVLQGEHYRIDRYDHVNKCWLVYRNVTHWQELPNRPGKES